MDNYGALKWRSSMSIGAIQLSALSQSDNWNFRCDSGSDRLYPVLPRACYLTTWISIIIGDNDNIVGITLH